MTHATDIVAYNYRAETLCPACTLDALNVPGDLRDEQSPDSIIETLGIAMGIDVMDERSFDSGDFPKVVFADQVSDCCDGQLDCERCDSCGEHLF